MTEPTDLKKKPTVSESEALATYIRDCMGHQTFLTCVPRGTKRVVVQAQAKTRLPLIAAELGEDAPLLEIYGPQGYDTVEPEWYDYECECYEDGEDRPDAEGCECGAGERYLQDYSRWEHGQRDRDGDEPHESYNLTIPRPWVMLGVTPRNNVLAYYRKPLTWRMLHALPWWYDPVLNLPRKLAALPAPNIYSSGEVCWGTNGEPKTLAEAWEIYWRSIKNFDLTMDPGPSPQTMADAYIAYCQHHGIEIPSNELPKLLEGNTTALESRPGLKTAWKAMWHRFENGSSAPIHASQLPDWVLYLKDTGQEWFRHIPSLVTIRTYGNLADLIWSWDPGHDVLVDAFIERFKQFHDLAGTSPAVRRSTREGWHTVPWERVSSWLRGIINCPDSTYEWTGQAMSPPLMDMGPETARQRLFERARLLSNSTRIRHEYRARLAHRVTMMGYHLSHEPPGSRHMMRWLFSHEHAAHLHILRRHAAQREARAGVDPPFLTPQQLYLLPPEDGEAPVAVPSDGLIWNLRSLLSEAGLRGYSERVEEIHYERRNLAHDDSVPPHRLGRQFRRFANVVRAIYKKYGPHIEWVVKLLWELRPRILDDRSLKFFQQDAMFQASKVAQAMCPEPGETENKLPHADVFLRFVEDAVHCHESIGKWLIYANKSPPHPAEQWGFNYKYAQVIENPPPNLHFLTVFTCTARTRPTDGRVPTPDSAMVEKVTTLGHFGSGALRGLAELSAPFETWNVFGAGGHAESFWSVHHVAPPAYGTLIPCLRDGTTVRTVLGKKMYQGRILWQEGWDHVKHAPTDPLLKRSGIWICWGEAAPV